MHDWKIDTSLLRGFRRNGHLVFPVQDARLKVLFWRGGAIKCQQLQKNGSSHDMCTKLLFVIYLPFLSESLASPSCLTVWECAAGYRSHPITLLLHCLSTVRALKTRSKSQPRSPRCGANVDQLRGNSTKAAAVWRNFSQGKCAMLSNLFLFFFFFFLSFFPCCHSGALTAARRESVGARVRKRKAPLMKVSLGNALFVWFLRRFTNRL